MLYERSELHRVRRGRRDFCEAKRTCDQLLLIIKTPLPLKEVGVSLHISIMELWVDESTLGSGLLDELERFAGLEDAVVIHRLVANDGEHGWSNVEHITKA